MRDLDLYCALVYYLKASFALDDTVLLSVVRTQHLDLQLGCSLFAPGLFLSRKLQLKLAYLRKDSYLRILQVNSKPIRLKLCVIVSKYEVQFCFIPAWREGNKEGKFVCLARSEDECFVVGKWEDAFVGGISGVGESRVEEVAGAERHDIGVLLPKFCEIFLNPCVCFHILQLKDLWILQVVEFGLQELSQSRHAFLIERLIDQLREDEPVNVCPLRESEAHPAQIPVALCQVEQCHVHVDVDGLLVRSDDDNLVVEELDAALLGQLVEAEESFHGGWSYAVLGFQILGNAEEALLG